jgi:nitrite reductase/ring-hydroxylating ferredoxin subunit
MRDSQRSPMVEAGANTSVPPAPLDRAELERSLASFGTSRMLPRAAYVDEAVLAWERTYLFDGWVCVGRTSDLAAAGSLHAYSMGDYGVLLSRDRQGRLRAFENACRHRGHELLPCGGASEPKAIVCPYHAWTYGFDGQLIGAPGFKDAEGYDKAACGRLTSESGMAGSSSTVRAGRRASSGTSARSTRSSRSTTPAPSSPPRLMSTTSPPTGR